MSFASLLRFWKLKVFWNANVVLQPPELQAEVKFGWEFGDFVCVVLFKHQIINIKISRG